MTAKDLPESDGQKELLLFDFDREYTLSDLLLPRPLTSIATAVCEAFLMGMDLLMPDGTSYYRRGSARDLSEDVVARIVSDRGVRDGEILQDASSPMAVFEVLHELECLGYLAVWKEGEGGGREEDILGAGKLLQKLVGFLMESRQQYLMTAGIHGQVVTDSYEQLQNKVAQLARSEEKYRLLSEQLEEEVAKKTRQIRMAQARLLQHEKQAAIGQLAGGMAHEINNPLGFVRSNLTTIRGYLADLCGLAGTARRVIGDGASGPRGEDMESGAAAFRELWKEQAADSILADTEAVVDETLSGIDRIAGVVQRLKIFSAVDHPGVLPTDVRQCIDSAVSVIDAKILERISIQRVYEEVPPIRCRRDELNQVFLNLLTNAIQSISGPGSVRITVRLQNNDRPFVEVGIADTGSGIAPEHIERVFEPFFTTRDVGQGMGLGLYAVYTIVRNMGGDIEVVSRPGEGTAFTLKLHTE